MSVEAGSFEHGEKKWTWTRMSGGSYGPGGTTDSGLPTIGPRQHLLVFSTAGEAELHTFVLRETWPHRPSDQDLIEALERAKAGG